MFDALINLSADTSSIPTGDFTLTLLGLIASIIVVVVIYKFLDRLPHKPQGSFSLEKETYLAHLIISFILVGISAVAWDIWWHRAIGRDSVLELPHIFLYLAVIIVVIAGIYGFYRTRHEAWKGVAISMLVVLISAPFDNLWHILFGAEDLSRPISLSWSLPHVVLSIAIIVALIFLTPTIVRGKHYGLKHFFGAIAFGSIAGILMFLLMPIHPTEGAGQLLGFWGAGILAGILAGVYMSAQKWLGGKVDAIRAGVVTILLGLFFIGEETASGIILLPHDKPPTWLFIIAHFIPLVFLDVAKGYLKPPIRGAIAAALYSFLLFGFSRTYFEAQFQYGNSDIVIAVFTSIIGGYIAGLIVYRSRKKSK